MLTGFSGLTRYVARNQILLGLAFLLKLTAERT
jgi:hypothetical protein